MHETAFLKDTIVQFVTSEHGYFAYSAQGRSLTIVRAHSYQPEIVDEEEYHTWLWVESLDGFYVLRQQIVAHEPKEWTIVAEIIPAERYAFFIEFLDHLPEFVAAL
ncbi:MAG: hypothetical protein FJX76_21505 [Armatimonadetes bacterium]|nr:hypothetical protein [Armatimonadota bacterium]